MKQELWNAFVNSASQILEAESKARIIYKGNAVEKHSKQTFGEVTILIGVTGSLSGSVLYSMNEATALKIASNMAGHQLQSMDSEAVSAIGELGNMITGMATIELERAGYVTVLSPPTIIYEKSSRIFTVPAERTVIPLTLDLGQMEIEIALKPANKTAIR